jgi:hypothetical protein
MAVLRDYDTIPTAKQIQAFEAIFRIIAQCESEMRVMGIYPSLSILGHVCLIC